MVEPLISVTLAKAGVQFKVHPAYHELTFEEKIRAMDDVARQLAEARAQIAVDGHVMFASLTPAEREVMGHVLRGLKTREISQLTGQAEGTIATLRWRAMHKVGAGGLVQLALAAAAAGGGTDGQQG